MVYRLVHAQNMEPLVEISQTLHVQIRLALVNQILKQEKMLLIVTEIVIILRIARQHVLLVTPQEVAQCTHVTAEVGKKKLKEIVQLIRALSLTLQKRTQHVHLR